MPKGPSMKIGNLIKQIHWPFQTRIQLEQVQRISNLKKLRQIAEHGRDEYVRLEAARQLNDKSLLLQSARKAVDENVRLQAALAIGDQSVLTSLALKEKDVQRGTQAISHIENKLLLRRIARSGEKDPIRLAAALRLNDGRLLKDVAESATDLRVRWQIARYLNDPHLMAGIALCHHLQTNHQNLRAKAHRALIAHLDQLEEQAQDSVLLAFMHISKHLPFKIEAFLRLTPGQVRAETVRHLIRQDFGKASVQLIDCFFHKIRSCGWDLHKSVHHQQCTYCRGRGQLPLSVSSIDARRLPNGPPPCPECRGRGRLRQQTVSCTDPKGNELVFHLPAKAESPK
jgi:hypothetical protein